MGTTLHAQAPGRRTGPLVEGVDAGHRPDEPTSRLDLITQEETLDALMTQVDAQGTALLMVTHDESLIRVVADRSVRLPWGDRRRRPRPRVQWGGPARVGRSTLAESESTYGGAMADESGFEVDIEELRSAGAVLVRSGDELAESARRGVLTSRGPYGDRALDAAAGRFADRFTYLVRGLGDDVAETGVQMRGAASSYEEQDAIIARNLPSPPR